MLVQLLISRALSKISNLGIVSVTALYRCMTILAKRWRFIWSFFSLVIGFLFESTESRNNNTGLID